MFAKPANLPMSGAVPNHDQSSARSRPTAATPRAAPGPRTAAGKAVVALNAVQHGLLSRQAVIQGESEAELVELGKRLRGQLAPMGELELLLVDRIVSTAWRLRRAIALETMLFDTERGDSSAYYGALAYKGDRDKLQLLSRYELTLERSLFRALHELQRLQAERQGQPVPPPVAVDLTVDVTTDAGPRGRVKWLCFGRNGSFPRPISVPVAA